MLCGSRDLEVLCEFPGLAWVRCGCGLISRRSGSAVAVRYHEEYFVSRENVRRHYDSRQRRRVRKSRSQILDVLNHAPPGPLLDVGCALGYTLQAARRLGLDAVGVDISEYAVRQCRERGLQAEIGALDALPFADGAFQLVIMKHVLEHTPRPREALREVRRVTRPGGGILIAVPHGGYLKARLNPTASRFFRPEVHGSEHHFYFTPPTLSRLLGEEGFEPVRVGHPHLVHRHAEPAMRVAQLAVAPLRFLAQHARSLARLDKEFWLAAVRNPG
jgi:SAM-dependent methyltransferase